MVTRSIFAMLATLAAGLSSASDAEESKPAQKPALQEEFLFSETTFVQKKGEIELSVAFDYRRGRSSWSAQVPFLVEYGLTNSIASTLSPSVGSISSCPPLCK
jgi:hypothetical protein